VLVQWSPIVYSPPATRSQRWIARAWIGRCAVLTPAAALARQCICCTGGSRATEGHRLKSERRELSRADAEWLATLGGSAMDSY
jgi:hypothetical protein